MNQNFDEHFNFGWYERRLEGRESVFLYITEICKKMECETVLDVGGGVGLLRRFLPKTMRYDVVDLSPKAKESGEPVFPDVHFTTGTIESIFDNYDAVIGISVVEHMNGYELFLKTAWTRANKIVIVTFFMGLDDKEILRLENRRLSRNYWRNKYSLPKLERWIKTEISPARMKIREIEVRRDYSPEQVLILYKE